MSARSWITGAFGVGAIVTGLGTHGCAAPIAGEAHGYTTSRYAGAMPLVVVSASPEARRNNVARWELFRGKDDPFLVAYSEDGEALEGLSTALRVSAARALTVQTRLNDGSRFSAARVVGGDRTAASRAIRPSSQRLVRLATSDLLRARSVLHSRLTAAANANTCDIDLTNAVLKAIQCMQTQSVGASACVTAALATVTSGRTCAAPTSAISDGSASAGTKKVKSGESGSSSSSSSGGSAKTGKTKRTTTASKPKKTAPRTPSKVDVSKKPSAPANDPVIDSIYTPEYYAKRFNEAGGTAASPANGAKDPFANPTIVGGGECVTCGLDSPFANPIMMGEGVCTTCEPTKEADPFADAAIVRDAGVCTTCGPAPTETDPFAGAEIVAGGECSTCSNTVEGGDVTASPDTGQVISTSNEESGGGSSDAPAAEEPAAEPIQVSDPAPAPDEGGSSGDEGIETLLLPPRKRYRTDDEERTSVVG